MIERLLRKFRKWRKPATPKEVYAIYAEGNSRFRILGDFSKFEAIRELSMNVGKAFMLVRISSSFAEDEAILEFQPLSAGLMIIKD